MHLNHAHSVCILLFPSHLSLSLSYLFIFLCTLNTHTHTYSHTLFLSVYLFIFLCILNTHTHTHLKRERETDASNKIFSSCKSLEEDSCSFQLYMEIVSRHIEGEKREGKTIEMHSPIFYII